MSQRKRVRYRKPTGKLPRRYSQPRRSTRGLRCEPLEDRLLLADLQVRFEYTNSQGSAITSAKVGDQFLLNAYVRDTRTSPTGISRAYFDFTYNASVARAVEPIGHGAFALSSSGSVATAGLIDEVGGLDSDASPPVNPSGELLLFSVPFNALASGSLGLTPDAADGPTRNIQFYFDQTPVQLNQIDFINGSLNIVGAGINVTPTSGLTTTEAGGTAPFSIVLTSQPTANVTINLSSSDTTEGTVSPASVTFTTANWNTARTVTVTGVDDAVDDGNVAYTIVTAPAVSTDSAFNGLNPSDVSVTNTNNDTARINVTAATPLTTSETGTTAAFQIVLNSQPTGNVTIPISSSDTTEGTVSVPSLVFTPQNWNVARTVTVTGVDDSSADGNVSYSIILGAATSTDTKYNGLNPADLAAINQDAGDTPGFTIQPASGLTTTETGGTATFQIRLNTQPAANVTIGLASSDMTEGTVAPASVTFTPANWNVFQTVTITGVDDDVADGNVAYSIVTAAATGDAAYAGLNPIDVSVTNLNVGDVAGFTIAPASGLVTSETGQTATFNVRLSSQPTANVTLPLSSSDTTEGTVSPTSLTFTPQNWNVNRLVTVTGVDDDLADGTVAYEIVTGAAASSDSAYNGLNPVNVSVSNSNDDIAAFDITPAAGLITTEAGGTATFTVRLRSRPSANVVLPLSSSDVTEGTVSPGSLTFTPANWNVTQAVTVTGVDDNVRDRDVAYTIVTGAATGSDAAYSGVNPIDVSVTNTDNDVVGVIVTAAAGLTTTEAGGTATFTIRLRSQPTANVTIPLSSSNAAEGTVAPATLTFTSQNWNVNQTVTVTGVDDFRDDGNIAYSIVTGAAASGDGDYSGFNAADVSVTNVNNDSAGIAITAPAQLATSEAGATATFEIVLKSQPTAAVTIPISSSDTTEGIVSVASVTFTPQNWNVSRTITVTGVDDSLTDGNVSYSIILGTSSSSDPKYNGVNPADLSAVNQDLDTPGFLIQPASGLLTTESGGSATFQIRLNSQPTSNVRLGLSSSDTTEGTVAPSSVTFTSANWNVPQTVTITGVDDDVADGNVSYSIITAPATGDAAYAGINPVDVSVTNLNVGDQPGFNISPTSGLVTSEAGQSATFTVRLNSQPTANVSLPLSTSDATEGTVSPASLTFTPQNWNVPQTVTIHGVNDAIDDGTIAYEIVTGSATSADASYLGLNPANVSVNNNDDADTASLVVSPATGLTTTEAGGTASLSIRLGSQPTAPVQVQLTSSDTSEGTVSPAVLTFTTANWNVNQSATLTGVDDDVRDRDVSYSIAAAASSADANYDNLSVVSVGVTNTDNDVVGVLIDPFLGLVTTEDGGTAQFTVRLRSEPTANVTIPLSSDDTTEGTPTPTSLVFTKQNWNIPQIVTVAGAGDFRADGDVEYRIVTGAAVSGDPDYNGLNAGDITVTNVDTGPAPGFLLTPPDGLTVAEEGQTFATFQFRLRSQPSANVRIDLASSDTTEGTVAPASLIFTEQNWNVPQTATVTGVDDPQADGDVPFTILTSATSQDSVYANLDPPDVAVVNVSDDPLAIVVSPTTGLETGEAGASSTFTIVLTSQPTSDVTIALASSNTNEGTVSPANVTFSSSNWNTPQSVTVAGVDDETVDGDQPFMILTAAAVSADPNYDGFDPPDVSLINRDDDSATLTLSPLSASQAEGTGGSFTDFVFQLELSRAVAGGFDVGYTTEDGTARAADGDYVDNDGVLSFEGQKCEIRTITVQVNQDNLVEADETFDVTVGPLSNLAAGLAERITVTTPRATATITNDDTASLRLIPISTAVQEGTGPSARQLTFEAVLSAPVQGGLRVGYAVGDGTARLDDGDYVDNDGTLTFAGTADERHTITIDVVQDDRVEADETLSVLLQAISQIDPNIVPSVDVDRSPVTATILNDDTATLTLSTATASQVEGSDGATTVYTFEVALSHAVQGGFAVAYTTDDGTATLDDGDYLDNDGLLTFVGTANETHTITVQVNQDLQIEPDETFEVALRQLSGTELTIAENITISGSPATATILNDDVPRLTLGIAEASQAEGTGETGRLFTFTVTLSDDIDDPDGFDVSFATRDGTATVAGGDYRETSGILRFTGIAGEMHTVTVDLLSDAVVEPHETFELVLGDVTGLEPGITVSTRGTPATATILNDDATTLTITPAVVSVDEGTDTTNHEVTFTVTLSNPVQGGLQVDYATVDGTATSADGDYVAKSATLAFNGNGGESQTVTVAIRPDAKVEADETLQLILAALEVADPQVADSIGLGAAAEVTLINDDTARVTLSPVAAAIAEGTGGTTTEFTFEVTLSNDVQGGFTIAYDANDGTATLADSDYVASNGILRFSGTSNETQTIAIQVNHDEQIEPNESFSVSLGAIGQIAPTAADDVTVSGSPAVATILNDDFPRLIVTANAVSQAEGNDGGMTEYTLTVTLSDAVTDPDGFDVSYSTSDGTATLIGQDYVDNDGVLHFDGTAGESRTVVVQVVRDATVEPDETFIFSLGEISGLQAGETVLVNGSPLTLTIENDDSATLELTPGNVSQSEGDGAVATLFTFEVTLSQAVQGGFTVGFGTQDGSASAAAGDYTSNSGTLIFQGEAGETQTITIEVNPDNQVELDETFQVLLGELGDLVGELAASLAVDLLPETATILNDDTTTVTVTAVSSSVAEGNGSGTTDVTLRVALANPVQGGFRIGYATNDGTATVAAADYVDNDGSLVFRGTANETHDVVVRVRRDNVVERDEQFTFGLTQLSDLNPALVPSVAVNTNALQVTVVNDDFATVSFVTAASSVAEASGQHTVEVVLHVDNSGSLSEAVTVDVAALPTSTAVAPGDFALDTTSLTFAAGSQDGARRTISLTLQSDDLMEEEETIDLQLSFDGQNLGGAVSTAAARHVVAVTDDPMTAAIRGFVWADTNNNARRDDGEMMIPGVTVRLSGQDLRGQVVEITTMTAADGTYVFDSLPGGTYRVTEDQPAAFHDGQEVLGTVAGASSGQIAADEFRGIVLEPGQQAAGYNFGEAGLQARYVTNRLFLASAPQQTTMLRSFVADGQSRAGNEVQAAAIRSGEAVQVRRIGSQVTVIGTSRGDNISFTPQPTGSGNQHAIEANGVRWTFDPAEVTDFIFIGGGGNDRFQFDDTGGGERLSTTRDTVLVTTQDYRAEITAIEFVRAISNSGGRDEAIRVEQAVDYLLQLEGDWLTP